MIPQREGWTTVGDGYVAGGNFGPRIYQSYLARNSYGVMGHPKWWFVVRYYDAPTVAGPFAEVEDAMKQAERLP